MWCTEYAGCEIARGVAEGVLGLAKLDLEAAQGVVNLAAVGVLDAAQAALGVLQKAVDLAVAAIEGVMTLAEDFLKGLASLLDISDLSFHFLLDTSELEVDMRVAGTFLKQPFDINFKAAIKFDDILASLLRIMKGVMASVFGGGKHSPPPPPRLGRRSIPDDFSAGANSSNRNHYQLPQRPLNASQAAASASERRQSTDYIKAPLYPSFPGALEDLYHELNESITHYQHGSVVVDLSNLRCGSIEGQGDCVNVAWQRTVEALNVATNRKLMYHVNETDDSAAAYHHRMHMSPLMRRCDTEYCRELAKSIVQKPWLFTFIAKNVNGNGTLPSFSFAANNSCTRAHVQIALDFSNNNYTGAVPDGLLNNGIVSLRLNKNGLRDNVAKFVDMPSLHTLNLLGNDMAVNSVENELVIPGCPMSVVSAMPALRRYWFDDNIHLVPLNPLACSIQQRARDVTTRRGVGAQITVETGNFARIVWANNVSRDDSEALQTALENMCKDCPIPWLGRCWNQPCANLSSHEPLLIEHVAAVFLSRMMPVGDNFEDSIVVQDIASLDDGGWRFIFEYLSPVPLNQGELGMTPSPGQTLESVPLPLLYTPGTDSGIVLTAYMLGHRGQSYGYDCLLGWDVDDTTGNSSVHNRKDRMAVCNAPTVTAACPVATVQRLVSMSPYCYAVDAPGASFGELETAAGGCIAGLANYSNMTLDDFDYGACVQLTLPATTQLMPGCVRALVPQFAQRVCHTLVDPDSMLMTGVSGFRNWAVRRSDDHGNGTILTTTWYGVQVNESGFLLVDNDSLSTTVALFANGTTAEVDDTVSASKWAVGSHCPYTHAHKSACAATHSPCAPRGGTPIGMNILMRLPLRAA